MKRINILLFLFASFFILQQAQSQSLIVGYDTLCISNDIQLSTTDTSSDNFYWGFCSAYLNNIPTGSSIASGTGLNNPTSIVMQKDGANYYVFVVNAGGSRDLIRYDFGTSMANAPVATNLGNFYNTIPVNPNGMQIIFDGTNWHGFLVGGTGPTDYHLVRIDFGNSLANTPSGLTDMSDLGGALVNPHDLYVFREAGNWNALIISGFGQLYSLNFGATVTNTAPTTSLLANLGAFYTGMWPVLENGNWYVFNVNRLTNTLDRINFGPLLANPTLPLVSNQVIGGVVGAPFTDPRDVSFIKDCGVTYAYVTNEGNNTITKLTFNNSVTNIPTAVDLGNFAGLNQPRFLTNYFRDKDNVFAFTANFADNSISRLTYNSCSISSIPNSTLQTPPVYTYSTPGTYNVYYVGDEGLPTMKVDCKLITVLPRPYMEITKDTAICQGDTIMLVANGIGNPTVNWFPVYNAELPHDTTTIFAYPREDYEYKAHFEFLPTGGCGFDTSMFVKVNRIVADAGPDVYVADGGITVLGGPQTSYGAEFKYKWRPEFYLSDTTVATPTCSPLDVQAYYFEVYSDSSRCVATDTVWVYTSCSDISMPNAFSPASDIPSNRNFGILNQNLAKIEYFKIFNRWGQLIFETTNPKKQWDGTFNNLDLPPDNYVWIIDGTCSNGKRIRKQGTVLLVR